MGYLPQGFADARKKRGSNSGCRGLLFLAERFATFTPLLEGGDNAREQRGKSLEGLKPKQSDGKKLSLLTSPRPAEESSDERGRDHEQRVAWTYRRVLLLPLPRIKPEVLNFQLHGLAIHFGFSGERLSSGLEIFHLKV